jgi:MOSC domain-containing protein YiiM
MRRDATGLRARWKARVRGKLERACGGVGVARVVAVCSSRRREDPKVDLGGGELIPGYGLLGDAHAGRSLRQVSLLALESIERVNREHGIRAVPGSFAENLTTQGLDVLSVRVGDRLRVGAALLEVVQTGKPPGEAHTYSYHGVSILPLEGVFCRVVEGGRVARGDAVELIPGNAR